MTSGSRSQSSGRGVSTVKRDKLTFWPFLRFAGWGIGIYLLAFLLMFDLGKAALPYDEEYYNGREVSIGPYPRLFPPTKYGIHYYGDEPYFWLFSPLCKLWRDVKGYEAPSDWRTTRWK